MIVMQTKGYAPKSRGYIYDSRPDTIWIGGEGYEIPQEDLRPLALEELKNHEVAIAMERDPANTKTWEDIFDFYNKVMGTTLNLAALRENGTEDDLDEVVSAWYSPCSDMWLRATFNDIRDFYGDESALYQATLIDKEGFHKEIMTKKVDSLQFNSGDNSCMMTGHLPTESISKYFKLSDERSEDGRLIYKEVQ